MRIIDKKDRKIIKNYKRQQSKKKLVEKDGDEVKFITREKIDLKSKKKVHQKSGCAPDYEDDVFANTITLENIYHKNLKDDDNDYNELVITNSENNNYDDYNLDEKSSIFHDKISKEIHDRIKNDDWDSLDLDELQLSAKKVDQFL